MAIFHIFAFLHKFMDLILNELERKALDKEKITKKVIINSIQYIRDPYIAEYVKRKANGICQDCNEPAPFINKKTGEPYLEIHHIIPLSEGGSDTIDNVIALCPNCHRKRHYG
ncbi:HNH endonuclease [Calditrichota bacterium GD2]